MRRALGLFEDSNLDVRLVSYGAPAAFMVRMAQDFR